MCLPTLMFKGEEGSGKVAFNVYKFIKNGIKTLVYTGGDKLFEADRAGTGCILIKRRVLEKIKKPFETDFNDDGIRRRGEDIYFSDKCKEVGFKIWGHWDYVCSHYKKVDLLNIANMIINSKNNESIKKDKRKTKKK
jgi:hypothetical protein